MVEGLNTNGTNVLKVFDYCHVEESADFCGIPLVH